MEKSEMIEKLGLFFVGDGKRMVLLAQAMRKLMIEQLKLLEDIEIFFEWYCGSERDKCPYTKELLVRLADDILGVFSRADADFIKKHRNDYEVLEIVCRNSLISSFDIVETVKLMDYIAQEEMNN